VFLINVINYHFHYEQFAKAVNTIRSTELQGPPLLIQDDLYPTDNHVEIPDRPPLRSSLREKN